MAEEMNMDEKLTTDVELSKPNLYELSDDELDDVNGGRKLTNGRPDLTK